MADNNFGFTGATPIFISIQDNIDRAKEYQDTHTQVETINWFYKQVRNNKDNHLSIEESMDYKQINRAYADFGNYNYAIVGKALGFSDETLKTMAGFAQQRSNGNNYVDSLKIAFEDNINFGDNPEDQILIKKALSIADATGISGDESKMSLINIPLNLLNSSNTSELTQSQRQELAQIISAGGNPNDFLRAVYENQQINIEIKGDNLEGFSSQAQADTTRNYYKSLNVNDGIENSDGSITWTSNGKAVAVEIKDEKGNIILSDTNGNKIIIDDKGVTTIHNEQTITFKDEHGNPTQITYEDNSDLLIYGDPANPNKIAFTDENGDYQVWEKDSEGNFVQINKVDYSGTLNTAINQIGSLIIMNNQDFSNVEKIVVSTSVATIADFATYKTKRKIL